MRYFFELYCDVLIGYHFYAVRKKSAHNFSALTLSLLINRTSILNLFGVTGVIRCLYYASKKFVYYRLQGKQLSIFYRRLVLVP